MANSGYKRLNDSFEEHRTNYGSTQPRVTFASGGSTEYFQLCDKITTNIFTINNATINLERMGRLIGTTHDSQVIRDRISQLSADTTSYVTDTTSLVRSVLLLIEGDKHKKVRAHKLQSEFESTASRFCQLQKKVVKIFSNASLPTDMVISSEETANQIVDEGRRELVQKQEFLNMEYEVAMQQERQQRVEALEKDVFDIGDIMREISSMTAAQGEVINTIEDNVENAASYVEESRTELIKAASYQAKHRKRCCILILISILVLIIIGIIIAMHYSN